MKKNANNSGIILIFLLVFMAIFVMLAGGIISLTLMQVKLSTQNRMKIESLHIAEAGINYYRWHLAHAPDDYQDGTGMPGPYLHDYVDYYGHNKGKFSLEIIPPGTGGNYVIIKSTGWLNANPGISSSIQVMYGKPSLAKYAAVSHDNLRFGEGTEIYGLIHSNGGIRFDGIAHNLVSSSKETYIDPDTGLTRAGVWTSQANEENVFLGGNKFPVTPVDFNAFTMDLAELKNQAIANGYYRGPSNKKGYHLVLNTNGTFNLYRVDKIQNNCWISGYGWQETHSIDTRTSLVLNEPFSANGVIFLEDDIWVNGQIDNARLTIVAARFPAVPSHYKSIYINESLSYTNYDGTDVIGLIAQNDIAVGLYSANNLRIDAALVAQNGRIGRKYYPSSCSSTYHKRNSIDSYGSLATNQRYGWSWVCGGTYCSGYEFRTITYDPKLIYLPPPHFPTSGDYTFISWEEN